MKRTKLIGGLVLLGVFALGAVAGGAGVWAWTKQKYVDEATAGPGRRFERRHFRALARELDLRDEQRARIEEIMRQRRPEREKLMKEMAEKCAGPMKEHKAKVDEEIRAVLDPAQQKRFDELLEKQSKRFPLMGPRRFGRHHGPPGGPPRGGPPPGPPPE